MAVFFTVGNITLDLYDIADGLHLDTESCSRHFFCGHSNAQNIYSTSIKLCHSEVFPKGKQVFAGSPFDGLEMSYRWGIEDVEGKIGIRVFFFDDSAIDSVYALVDEAVKKVVFFVDAKRDSLKFDVFLNPIGILLFIYLVLMRGGLTIHASGVDDDARGYVFTGLSGIGKSTMARLWMQCGAKVINDDRLLLVPQPGGIAIHNTPMPYYADSPKICPLNAVFLLEQAPQNRIEQIKGTQAMLRTMANCMQHFHSPGLVKLQLDAVEKLVGQVPVYVLGFKPDADVVHLVRGLAL